MIIGQNKANFCSLFKFQILLVEKGKRLREALMFLSDRNHHLSDSFFSTYSVQSLCCLPLLDMTRGVAEQGGRKGGPAIPGTTKTIAETGLE